MTPIPRPTMRCFSSLAIALLVASAPLAAQGTSSPASPTTPSAAPIAPAARALADTLIDLMNSESVLRASIQASFDEQIKMQPAMAPFRPTMEAWVERYVTWSELRPRISDLYARAYTQPELRGLIAFYRSPVGRRSAAVMPDITRQSASIGAEVVQAHLPQLQQMIQARMAELQGGTGTPEKAPPR